MSANVKTANGWVKSADATNIVDNLTTPSNASALSANMGRELAGRIERGIHTAEISVVFNDAGFSDLFVNGNIVILSARIIDGNNNDIANRGIRVSIIGGDNGHGSRLWLYNEFSNERIANQTHNCMVAYINV
ncbi:MAG: hypothetical protein MJ007_01910 [Paludibacteraceae bacterium]|nr:hypothetical protein [Paludibacteraceae bacterium]